MVFHFTNNAMAMLSTRLMPRITPELIEEWPVLDVLLTPGKDGYAFSWIAIAGGAFIGAAILIWFALLASPRSVEETIQEAIKKELVEDDRKRLRSNL